MLSKIYMSCITISMVFLFLGITQVVGVGWQIETIDSNGDVGLFTSIGIDSVDYPHISYYDYSNLNLKYARMDSGHWVIETLDSNGDVGSFTSLSIDSKDFPHISYYDYTNRDLKYTHKIVSGWQIEVVDSVGDVGMGSSLDLDANDNPHISYYDYFNACLKYSYKDDNGWHTEVVDSSGNVGLCNSIEINQTNYPCIAYLDFDGWDLKYAYKDNNGWHIEVIDSDDDVGTDLSLALDKSGNPHISYYNFTTGDLKYTCKKDGKWDIITVDSIGDVGLYTSIVIDKRGYPHISYYDYTNQILKYAFKDVEGWHIEIIDDSKQVGTNTSIVLNSKGQPCVSYSDDLNCDLKYAWNKNPQNDICLTSFTAKSKDSSIILKWIISTDEDIIGFNLYRRTFLPPSNKTVVPDCSVLEAYSPLKMNDNTKWTRVNISLIRGSNPYSYTDRDIAPNTNYEYKLEVVKNNNAETLGTTMCASDSSTPSSFEITRVYPCPADSRITIDVIIPERSDIDIGIYDISGRRVSTIANGLYNQGEYTLTGDVSGLTDSVYIVRMTEDGLSVSKRFVIMR
ncbi:MAG: T9SS type A sorting domain-containing protein [bacterium]